jgi:hypothetical protein
MSRYSSAADSTEEFLPSYGKLPAPDPKAPALFLLRLSKSHTLRLMLKEWSKHQWQWYPRNKIFKKEEENAYPFVPNESTQQGSISEVYWIQHKMSILDLAPQYHLVAQEISSKRIYDLWLQWSSSRDEVERAHLKSQALQERNSDSGWSIGEDERTGTIPLVADCSRAEELLFTVNDGVNSWRLDEVETSQSRKQVGSWAFLLPWQYRGREESNDLYMKLAKYLEKKDKVSFVFNVSGCTTQSCPTCHSS